MEREMKDNADRKTYARTRTLQNKSRKETVERAEEEAGKRRTIYAINTEHRYRRKSS